MKNNFKESFSSAINKDGNLIIVCVTSKYLQVHK